MARDMLHHEEVEPDERIEVNGTLGTAECLVVERFPHVLQLQRIWHGGTLAHHHIELIDRQLPQDSQRSVPARTCDKRQVETRLTVRHSVAVITCVLTPPAVPQPMNGGEGTSGSTRPST